MGYDVYITRANNWFEAKADPIVLEEWLDYVRSDPEMRLDGVAVADSASGESIRYTNRGLSVWTKYSRDGEDGNHAWFDLQGGCVVVKNPDREILVKMFQVAMHFKARVQGDEGENYDLEGNPITDF
ncbi:MAG TPA: hypothetical protein VHM70_18185 [Polyangiaceae bacterium]|jgi:hypothetical protein|nr:hypothetical protein [Polyangiaceae bacterium]